MSENKWQFQTGTLVNY